VGFAPTPPLLGNPEPPLEPLFELLFEKPKPVPVDPIPLVELPLDPLFEKPKLELPLVVVPFPDPLAAPFAEPLVVPFVPEPSPEPSPEPLEVALGA
jgi:hypothetical protein